MKCALFIAIWIFSSSTSFSQILPVGSPLLEDTYRRLQNKGEGDSNCSFSIRPVTLKYTKDSISGLLPSFFPALNSNEHYIFKKKQSFKLLPLTIKQQYNSHHPYGWNDGSMIPAKGYQNQFSFGIYSKIGPLSIQINPELVYAQNKEFSCTPISWSDSIWKSYYYVINRIDNPEKYGNDPYLKLFPGQSSVRINLNKLSLGLSTENLWWGPGIRNSLVMSNNAPGFPHISFNTSEPVVTKIGSFEWQVISGKLKGSGLIPSDTSQTFNGENLYVAKQDDGRRYLNGMIVTWQPKWTKGLYLGFTNTFYLYQSDLQPGIKTYLPILGFLFKSRMRSEDYRTDQMLSLFFRLVLAKENAEVYGEFGKNDNALNLIDLLLEPEHTRAYILGFRKTFNTPDQKDLELFFEATELQNSSTQQLRFLEGWYTHYQVRHGYTQLGQVIGAGIGPGGSSQIVGINWIKGIKDMGVSLERIVHNNDFYYDAFGPLRDIGSHWVDISLNMQKNWLQKRFIYSANLSIVKSLNYYWQKDNYVNNLHASMNISYMF
jgi:hypothetical protein